jgi:hypothetical protein
MNIIVTDKFLRDWARIRRKVDTLKGDETAISVSNSPDSILIKGRPTATRSMPVSSGGGATRFKIKTAASAAGIVIANSWDGSTLGTTDVPILASAASGKAGEIIWALNASTGMSYNGANVTWIEVGIGSKSSPATISGSGASADSTAWSINANGTPLQITVMTRVFYDNAAHVLYGFNRTFIFSSRGALVSVSAESQVTLDTLSGC